MRINVTISILSAAILSFSTSCTKESENKKTSEINIPKFQDCYTTHLHDSATVANKLIGTWDWQEQSCMNNSSVISPGKVVKATFNSSGQFVVIENSNVLTLGNWTLKMFGNNFFGVDSTAFEFDINQSSGYLNGIIFICDNQLLLCNSYADGCNTLYKKE
jgi:hypothetical protein